MTDLIKLYDVFGPIQSIWCIMSVFGIYCNGTCQVFWTSSKDFRCLLVGDSSQGRGSEWSVRGSDPPNSYQ